jgi:hypothetical protein
MSGVTIVIVGALLFAVLLALGAIMLWQEGKSRTMAAPPTYVIEDAVDAAWEHLDEATRARITKAGVRRIIEWEVFYLQGLADKKAARAGITVVAGGDARAVSYVQAQLARHGHEYAAADIAAVLEGEAWYLASIGAIGEIANEDV